MPRDTAQRRNMRLYLAPARYILEQKHQVGKAIGHRAADRHDGGIAIMDSRNPQDGDQRPTDDIAQGDGRHPGDDPQVGPLPKGAQVNRVDDGRLYEAVQGKTQNDFFNWCFHKFHLGIELLTEKIGRDISKRR